MREILFRGKRIDNGEWVCGYLFASDTDNSTFIVCGSWNVKIEFEVDSATIGQYTGLTGKNGVKVFEGDIVRCSRGCPHEVVWIQEHGGTFVGGMPTFYLSGLSDGYAWTGEEEVIGNIHDNPDLLNCRDNG